MTSQASISKVASLPLEALTDKTELSARTLGPRMPAHLCKRSAGTVLTLEGDEPPAVLSVLSGWVGMSKSLENGHRQIVDVLLPGETISALRGGLSAAAVQIETLTETIAMIVPHQDFAQIESADPKLRMRLDRTAAAMISRMSERMLRLGRASAEARIAYAICELCLRSRAGGLHDGAHFVIPMNQQQMGDFTGLSAVHVCRVLRRFKQDRILTLSDRMEIVISDAARLATLAEIDPAQLRERLFPSE